MKLGFEGNFRLQGHEISSRRTKLSAVTHGYNPSFTVLIQYSSVTEGQTDAQTDRRPWLKRRGLAQGCAFWGLKNLKLIFNVFIRKNRKNYNGAYGEN